MVYIVNSLKDLTTHIVFRICRDWYKTKGRYLKYDQKGRMFEEGSQAHE